MSSRRMWTKADFNSLQRKLDNPSKTYPLVVNENNYLTIENLDITDIKRGQVVGLWLNVYDTNEAEPIYGIVISDPNTTGRLDIQCITTKWVNANDVVYFIYSMYIDSNINIRGILNNEDYRIRGNDIIYNDNLKLEIF